MSNNASNDGTKNTGHKWQKGESGNPAGRKPDYELKKLQALFRTHTQTAMNKILHLMEHAEKDDVMLRAAQLIIERGWGKTPLTVTLEGGDNPIKHTIEAMTPEERAERLQWLLKVGNAGKRNK